MVSLTIHLSLSVAVLFAAIGAGWMYYDAKRRGMDTADMWAVGFFVGFFIIPILGSLAVLFYYFQKRDPQYPQPGVTPSRQRR